jgi:hypothetical protein
MRANIHGIPCQGLLQIVTIHMGPKIYHLITRYIFLIGWTTGGEGRRILFGGENVMNSQGFGHNKCQTKSRHASRHQYIAK